MSLLKSGLDVPVVPGTYFWGHSTSMRSNHASNDRPLIVIKIIDGICFCCPSSSKSDAWNEQNASHVIPKELNEWVMGGKDSYFAVNRLFGKDGGFVLVPVEVVANQCRKMLLPEGFVLMATQLISKWQDVKDEVKSRWNAPLSKSIKKSSSERVPVTTQSLMSELTVTAVDVIVRPTR